MAEIPVPVSKGRRGGLVGKWLLLLLVLAICFVIGEFFTRILLKERTPLFPRYHTGADYGQFKLRRLRPNSTFYHESVDGRWKFVTNTQGFRDDQDYAYEKPPGRLRVLSLGDSHTQGFEVRQDRTFSEVIERRLKTHQFDAEVLNAGISGFSSAEQLAFLEGEGLKYRPDVVVVGFFSNDFEDNIKAGLFAVEGGQLVLKKTEHQPGVRVLDPINSVFLFRWLSENSYFYSVFFNTGWAVAKNLLLSESEARLQTEFAIPTEKVSNYKEELTVALFQKMHRVCKANGIQLIIIDIPSMDYGDASKAFYSSIPPTLVSAFEENSDALFLSESVLGPFRGLTDTHLPHGHNHISEFSHLMFGVAVADEIMKTRAAKTSTSTRIVVDDH